MQLRGKKRFPQCDCVQECVILLCVILQSQPTNPTLSCTCMCNLLAYANAYDATAVYLTLSQLLQDSSRKRFRLSYEFCEFKLQCNHLFDYNNSYKILLVKI